MAITQPWLRGVFGVTRPVELWWDIQPISAGVFGVPVGFVTIIIVSLLTRPPGPAAMQMVDEIRAPEGLPPPPA
jgi:cation/acetate symporter